MSLARRHHDVRSFLCVLACTIVLSAPAAADDMTNMHHGSMSITTPPVGGDAAFVTENDAAMTKMMTEMAVKPTGDVDRDFVAMMEPHHRGAIAMAQALLRYSKNEKLRRIAQDIVTNQRQEIIDMHAAIGESSPTPASTTK